MILAELGTTERCRTERHGQGDGAKRRRDASIDDR